MRAYDDAWWTSGVEPLELLASSIYIERERDGMIESFTPGNHGLQTITPSVCTFAEMAALSVLLRQNKCFGSVTHSVCTF